MSGVYSLISENATVSPLALCYSYSFIASSLSLIIPFTILLLYSASKLSKHDLVVIGKKYSASIF